MPSDAYQVPDGKLYSEPTKTKFSPIVKFARLWLF